jgi:hypothetical protein
MNEQVRQGDVLVRHVRKRDVSKMHRVNAVRGRIILARGEATGHAHAIAAARAALYRGKGGKFYLHLDGASRLEHEEHAAITLPPGFYEVTRQREYSPRDISRSRRVAD